MGTPRSNIRKEPASPFLSRGFYGASSCKSGIGIRESFAKYGYEVIKSYMIVADGLSAGHQGREQLSFDFKITRDILVGHGNFASKYPFIIETHAMVASVVGNEVLLRSLGRPPVGAMVLRLNPKSYTSVLVSKSNQLILGNVEDGDIVAIAPISVVRLGLRIDEDTLYGVMRQLYGLNPTHAGPVLAATIKLE